jgi:hypothetical protein
MTPAQLIPCFVYRPPACRLSVGLVSPTMVSLLFALGLMVGIGGAVIALAGVVIAGVTAVAWLNSLIVNARHAARRAQST